MFVCDRMCFARMLRTKNVPNAGVNIVSHAPQHSEHLFDCFAGKITCICDAVHDSFISPRVPVVQHAHVDYHVHVMQCLILLTCEYDMCHK